jgi:hypothetical protein
MADPFKMWRRGARIQPPPVSAENRLAESRISVKSQR